jgi:hypothetical protein
MDRRNEREAGIIGPFLFMMFFMVALNVWSYLTQP